MNFYRDSLEGQLRPDEREALYNFIVSTKPLVVCEVGTWRGGGSTYYIAEALRAVNCGYLYTCEPCSEHYNYALKLYDSDDNFRQLARRITFSAENSLDYYGRVLPHMDVAPDIAMLDGAEDPFQTEKEFALFNKYMRVGSHFIFHDWASEKCKLVKIDVETNIKYQIVSVVSDLAIVKKVA